MSGVKGRSGGRPMASEMHVLAGTDRPDRQKPDEPKPDLLTLAPAPPVVLDADAKREWNRIAPELVRLHLLSNIDLSALVAYCDAFSARAKAAKEIKRRGRYVMGANKVRVLNPAVRDQYRALELMRQYIVEFGMSPSSRARVATGGGGAVGKPHGEGQAPRPQAVNRFGAAV